eukprot:g4122.t1
MSSRFATYQDNATMRTGSTAAGAGQKNNRKRNALGDVTNKNGDGAAGGAGALKKMTSKMSSLSTKTSAAGGAAGVKQPSRPEGESQHSKKRGSFGRAGQNISSVRDIDEVNSKNPQYATEYINDMQAHFRNEEGRSAISASYMKSQTDINEKMRAILIDWLIEVHLKFKLKLETLYLTINVIDRFLERTLVSRQKLQLVGVTALLLASKYEEIYPPEIRELVYITDKAYTRAQILKMESVMLNVLKFKMTVPTVHMFLPRYVKAAQLTSDSKTAMVARYFAEKTLQEYSFLKYLPSTIAAASVSLALRVSQQPEWTPTLQHYTRYQEATIQPCMADIVNLIKKSTTASLQAVRKKYTSSKFQSSAIVAEAVLAAGSSA